MLIWLIGCILDCMRHNHGASAGQLQGEDVKKSQVHAVYGHADNKQGLVKLPQLSAFLQWELDVCWRISDCTGQLSP